MCRDSGSYGTLRLSPWLRGVGGTPSSAPPVWAPHPRRAHSLRLRTWTANRRLRVRDGASGRLGGGHPGRRRIGSSRVRPLGSTAGTRDEDGFAAGYPPYGARTGPVENVVRLSPRR